MFLHLSVSHSVHRGGLPQCMLGYSPPPGAGTPQEQAPPTGADTPSPREQAPPEQVPPRAGTPSPKEQAPPFPQEAHHTPQQTATVADGTHPTGMHSCLRMILISDYILTYHFIKMTLVQQSQNVHTLLVLSVKDPAGNERCPSL